MNNVIVLSTRCFLKCFLMTRSEWRCRIGSMSRGFVRSWWSRTTMTHTSFCRNWWQMGHFCFVPLQRRYVTTAVGSALSYPIPLQCGVIIYQYLMWGVGYFWETIKKACLLFLWQGGKRLRFVFSPPVGLQKPNCTKQWYTQNSE
jgi:hypothetical protein